MATKVIKLRTPITFGSTVLEELELKTTGRALREFSLPMTPEGKIDYQPHALAVVGLKMAGQVAAAATIVDKMEDLQDLSEIAQTVMGFFAARPTTGNTP